MRKRKERTQKERSETLISNTEERNEEYEEEAAAEEDEGKGFYACYLLCSLCPRFKGHTYIGYTVNPCRRIRQHNGQLTSGAVRTKKKRPWEMMLCIYGFPTNVSALKFEWAWQHPIESLAVREAALSFKSLSGIANRVKLAFTMLTLPPWQSLKLTVNFFSTMYTKHAAGCPSLPKQMKIQVCSMDELPCYIGDSQESDEIDDEEEREHEDGGNGVGEISQSERSEDISVENSVAYPNTDHDWERLIEDDGFQQQMDSHSPREEDKERPSCENGENGMGEMNQSEIFNDILENAAAYPSFYHDWESMIEYDGLQQHGGAYCPTRSRDVDSSPEALSTRMARIVNKRQRVKESILSGSFANTGANKLGHLTKKMLAKIGHNNLWQPTMEMLTTTPDVGGFQSPPSGSFLHPVPFRQQKEFLTSIDKEASLSSFITDSPLQMPSSIISTFVDTTQAVENRNSVELIEETGGKFGRTRLPAFVVDSPVHPPSSSISRSVDAVQKLEDRDSFELIEETGSELWLASMQQMATMTASSENHSPSKTRLPSFVIDSPVHPPSSSISRFFDTVQEVEDRETFELIEETGSELGRASKQQTTTMTVSGEDHSPSKTSPLCPPEVCFRQPRDKRGRPPFCVLDSPMEKPSSSVIEFPCGLTPKGCANKMNEANKQQLRVPGNNNYDQQASSSSAFRPSPEVEVINLLTPSPDCTNDSFHSKKRRTLVHRDLIDLTRSPMFVQL